MSHTNNINEDIREALMKGYMEMSEINIEEAEAANHVSNEAMERSEKILTECE